MFFNAAFIVSRIEGRRSRIEDRTRRDDAILDPRSSTLDLPSSFASSPFARFAAAFPFKPDLADDHAAINGLEHIIKGQGRHGHGGHGFHLDAGLRAGRSRSGYARAVLFERDLNVDIA